MYSFKKSYINNALKALEFQTFTEIQEKIIPYAIKGRDIIGASETGSGKSHAFLLPIFEQLDESLKKVQAVIVSPTRELASQIEKFAKEIASYYEGHISIKSFQGGSDREKEIAWLKNNQPQIVIGTPGKLYDLLVKEHVLKIHTAKTLVIDETDMALEQGFMKEIEAIASTVKKDSQMMVFSATIPKHLEHFVQKSMHHPHKVILDKKRLKHLDINHYFLRTTKESRLTDLEALMKTFNPYLAIIFTNTKEDAAWLGGHLRSLKYKVTTLHGDLSSRERKQSLRDIDKLNVQYIIASDMASRGIDIKGVSHIINYEFPKDMTFYIHRSGRTGRMKMSGDVYTLYTKKNQDAFDFLMKEEVAFEFITLKKGEIVTKETDKQVLTRAYQKNVQHKQDTIKQQSRKRVK